MTTKYNIENYKNPEFCNLEIHCDDGETLYWSAKSLANLSDSFKQLMKLNSEHKSQNQILKNITYQIEIDETSEFISEILYDYENNSMNLDDKSDKYLLRLIDFVNKYMIKVFLTNKTRKGIDYYIATRLQYKNIDQITEICKHEFIITKEFANIFVEKISHLTNPETKYIIRNMDSLTLFQILSKSSIIQCLEVGILWYEESIMPFEVKIKYISKLKLSDQPMSKKQEKLTDELLKIIGKDVYMHYGV